MLNESRVGIVIEAQDRATAQLKRVESSLGSIQKRMVNMRPTFQRMAIAGTAAFGALAFGIGKAVSVARDFEEETNKFNVVFQEVGVEAQKMADTLNKSFGLSRLEAKRLLSSTGDILTGFGFTGKAALDLSSQVNTLAVDLASFTNAQGGAKSVSEALTKALLGERESLKTYGISILDADVKAEVLAMGMAKLTGEALRQAKAQATLNLALRQSKNAVGDYARSTGTLTQTQVELKKSVEDMQIVLGEVFAPILNDILQRVVPIVSELGNWIKENQSLTKIIVLSTGALAILVATLGAIGLILPSVIGGIGILSKGLAFLRATTLSTALALNVLRFTPAIASFVALGSAIMVVVNALNLLSDKKNEAESRRNLEEITERATDVLGAERVSELLGDEGRAILDGETREIKTIDRAEGFKSFNFDFSGATIANKEDFIKDISKGISRALNLTAQGI